MKIGFVSVLLILAATFLTNKLGYAQENKPGPTNSPTPSNQMIPTSRQTVYRFKSNTVWGHINLIIVGSPENFKVEVKSDESATGWILKKAHSRKTLSKGGLSSARDFQFKVNQPFQGDFHLTLFLNSDRDQVPVIIPLSSNLKSKNEMPSVETPDDFLENPDHPYNSMVKSLYESAVQDYLKGDNPSALARLRNAEELDPDQPQVQALLQKINATSKSPADDLLIKAKTCLESGDKKEALENVIDYLKLHPDDQQALELKGQIEAKVVFHKSRKRVISRSREDSQDQIRPPVHSPKIKVPSRNDEDTQAQADQAYNLGLDSYRKGDYPAAKKFWEQTLQILPNHQQAQRNLDRLKDEHPDLP